MFCNRLYLFKVSEDNKPYSARSAWSSRRTLLPGTNLGLEPGGSTGDVCNLGWDCGICGGYCLDSNPC